MSLPAGDLSLGRDLDLTLPALLDYTKRKSKPQDQPSSTVDPKCVRVSCPSASRVGVNELTQVLNLLHAESRDCALPRFLGLFGIGWGDTVNGGVDLGERFCHIEG